MDSRLEMLTIVVWDRLEERFCNDKRLKQEFYRIIFSLKPPEGTLVRTLKTIDNIELLLQMNNKHIQGTPKVLMRMSNRIIL
uniref:Uncharacterized protein n=1 Tax=Heterorhabditis bacteriophora TaxID=37862 RepID=A0A1I7WH71_HETBA